MSTFRAGDQAHDAIDGLEEEGRDASPVHAAGVRPCIALLMACGDSAGPWNAGMKKPAFAGLICLSHGAQERTRTSTVLPAST